MRQEHRPGHPASCGRRWSRCDGRTGNRVDARARLTRETLALAAAVFVAWAGDAWAETRRLAIVVGNNAGAEVRPPLRYAESDAGKMARLLVELGEVNAHDVLLLQGRGAAELERALTEARERVQAWRRLPEVRSVLLFYFSGHSDGEALELGREKVSYGRLKALLAGSGAEVRVAIVDACRSGGALREKGGRPADPFTIKLTDTLSATGEAFITSSAADEAALESSEVMGGLFTHNLISGLRGAADASGDKLITLAEAYRYAYDRTVSASSILPAGSQHPTYDYRLSGQGELVLTSLQKTSSTLVLPEGAERALVMDLTRDQVLVEVPPGASREIALAPGSYGLRLTRGGQSFGGRVQLTEGGRRALRWDELAPLRSSMAVVQRGPDAAVQAGVEHRRLLLGASLGAIRGATRGDELHGLLRLSLEPEEGSGTSFGLVGATGTGGAGPRESSLQFRAGYRGVWMLGPVWLSAGGEAGLAYFWQSGAESNWMLTGGAGPRGTARLQLSRRTFLSLEAEVPVFLLRVDEKLVFAPLPSAALGVAVAL